MALPTCELRARSNANHEKKKLACGVIHNNLLTAEIHIDKLREETDEKKRQQLIDQIEECCSYTRHYVSEMLG
jgi:hypothetical protein